MTEKNTIKSLIALVFLTYFRQSGSSQINGGAMFLRFFTVALLLFIAEATGGSNPVGYHYPLTNLTQPKIKKLLCK